MNSLFKFYSKKTLVLLFIGIALALLFTYTGYSNYVNNLQYTDGADVWSIASFVDEYASSCFIINTILVFILTYIFNMHRNKKTGIFIRQLPIKYNKDFVFKVFLTLLLIILLVFFEVVIFDLLTKSYLTNEYNMIINSNEYINTVQESLSEIYQKYYKDFIKYAIITIFIASTEALFISTIGVIIFAIFMPIIIYVSGIGFIVGIGYFSSVLKIDYIFTSTLRIIVESIDFVFNTASDKEFYIILLIISTLIFICAYFCNKYINYSKIGQLFIFNWVKYIAYIVGSLFGGFSFYWIAYSIIEPITILSNIVTLLISIIVAFIVIKKVEKIFI